MSESAAHDEKRNFWKELLKKKIVAQFSSALVGGKRHADYLVQLGMKSDRIFLGYDVVDNDYFLAGVTEVKKQKDFWRKKKNLPENYFLVVSRFIEKKNLPFIIKAFNQYQKKAGSKTWHLYILGNGILEKELLQLTNDLGLNHIIHFEGFKQYNELPIYFGLAKALLHGSTTEQWGLVVNEAMASGLPVIISERCGCVPELVHNGINGFSFNPYNQEQLISILHSFADSTDSEIEKMGQESLKVVSSFNTDAFGTGMVRAAEKAKKEEKVKGLSISMKLILRSLINR
jgi:glycosyltransferase involved in cell wall biosynthesis